MGKASGKRGFYSTQHWRNLAAKILRERPVCECGCGQASAFADHIQPIRDPYELQDPMIWDRGNIQALSDRCHRQKSRRELGEAGKLPPVRNCGPKIKGCDANGMPLDPDHPWNSA